jgi:plastocyanin domain-containing protein
MQWLLTNKEWIFSGIGVSIIGGLVSWFFRNKQPSQSQKSGNHSENYQSGGNISIGDRNDK